jgi:hypothetical protein
MTRSELAVVHGPLAVRAHVPPRGERGQRWREGQPELVLVLDFETLTDASQALTFGSYRVYRASGRLVHEGLVHADDLPHGDLAILQRYVQAHSDDRGGRLRLLSRTRFLVEVLWPIGYEARALIVGYNLPFDLSRLACGWQPSRLGGLTLKLWQSVANDGTVYDHLWRPGIRIRALDAKRQFIEFTGPAKVDKDNLVEQRTYYRGRFLDLHTLAYALTDRNLTLDGAAAAFGLASRKHEVEGHGVMTEAYVDYNRQDVRLTWHLYVALSQEWERHPIDIDPEQAFSPAGVAKGYLRVTGITPLATRATTVTPEVLGYFMAAYLGGRSEERIRRVPLPVRYVDFSSMYTSVFALLNLHEWLIAKSFKVVDATAQARTVLARANHQALYDPELWRRLAGVVCRVRPSGNLLPARSLWGSDPQDPAAGGAWTIGLNRVTSHQDLWFALPDLIVDKLHGGRIEILEAIAIQPVGRLSRLRPIELRGELEVDPRVEDLFRTAIEERARLKVTSGSDDLRQFLKTYANAGAYGIFAEYRALVRSARPTSVTVFGLSQLDAKVYRPEEPGEFCYEPLATSITATARLLLALLEAEVTSRGGSYIACDTDSLLIVAGGAGQLLPCAGGPHRLPDGRPAVKVLSEADIDAVIANLNRLNPYAPGTVESLLKLEDENLAPDGTRRDLRAIAISPKRYALYELGEDGPVFAKVSSHGLGLYVRPCPNPPDWDRPWPWWIEEVWRRIVLELEGLPMPRPPHWFAAPAISRLPITQPADLAPFAEMNAPLPFAAQVKPFNFLTMGHDDPLVPLPPGLDRKRLTLVATYIQTADQALGLPWRNRFDGRALEVTTQPGGRPDAVRLRTIADVIRDYRLHPDPKSGDPEGGRSHRGSQGLLPRLHLRVTGVRHIGKESNRLDEVEGGIVRDAGEVYTEYRDPRREWAAAVPRLREIGVGELARLTGMSERTLRSRLNSGRVPHPRERVRLTELARKLS